MAQAPTQEKVTQVIAENQDEHDAKVDTQAAQGKSFLVPADGHGPGVIPEPVWRNLPGKVAA